MTFDIESYRTEAERLLEELDREYYLHFAGHKADFELEAIYDRYADLCTRGSVEALREAVAEAEDRGGEELRRRRYLLRFATDGYLGRETRAEAAEMANLEASLEVEAGSERLPYRMVAVEQANEEDSERRRALEDARNAVLEQRLNPLHREVLERSHRLVTELGWDSYADAYADLCEIDLAALGRSAAEFLERTEDSYARIADPELVRHVGAGLGEVQRWDLPRFFRAAGLDAPFPASKLLPSFAETVADLGVDLASQSNVTLDTEARPSKSPRAFCATPRVPDEVYLVVQPIGGREDFAALLHEGGHTEHFANTDPELPFEYRHLGDNSVTESFAFLFDHLSEDPDWLRLRLGVDDPEPVLAHARAVKLVFLRRYAAKLAFELELHGPGADLQEMPKRYASLLGAATRVDWPAVSWLSDVDPGFYVACYLRAWALESRWRAHLRRRFGTEWFTQPEAGGWLRGLWSQGQRLRADELLAEQLGEELNLGALAEEFV